MKVRVIKKNSIYKNETGIVVSAYVDEYNKKIISVKMSDYTRQTFKPSELEVIKQEKPKPKPKGPTIDTSMFLGRSGGTSANMRRAKNEIPKELPQQQASSKVNSDAIVKCSECGDDFYKSERAGLPGKLSHCPSCAEEIVERYRGVNIFSHKTCPDIEIKQGDKLIKEAGTFNYKGIADE
jgi:formylmethanofuran dehydrogenase subunit E